MSFLDFFFFFSYLCTSVPHVGTVEEASVSEVQTQAQEGSCTLLVLEAGWLELSLENERQDNFDDFLI